MDRDIHIIGGGTFNHVRNHLALAAPAFGQTARKLYGLFDSFQHQRGADFFPTLHLTRMANPENSDAPVTNEDVSLLIDRLIDNPATRVIILNAALCDYEGSIVDPDMMSEVDWDGYTTSGKYAERLKTSAGKQRMILDPADKLIGRIRAKRKDIFVVGFKTTTGATPDEQYRIALNMLKRDSLNLVLANDTVTRHNMIVAPEETRYAEGPRDPALLKLVEMVLSRSSNTFTRSTVVEGSPVAFQTDERVPDNLRQVVNHLVERGAYKPFRNATAGHFAVRIDDGRCLTSRRKTNYTAPGGLDLVEVEYDGLDRVIAHGAKPSVGGQSQRIVFSEHPDLDCIVHAHVPLRSDARDAIPTAEQWRNECGSHQCGANTSRNLAQFGSVQAVMLDDHGPNIVFSRNTPASEVIDFIEANFDLRAKTGGLVDA